MKKHISEDKRLIKEWDWEKNKEIGLDPNALTLGSKQNAYWLCEKGHSFYSRISHRANGSNCPYCYGRKAIVGETDLATTNPVLASEWHPTKNGDLTPKDVKANSNNRVWWKCSTCGNEWISDINSRNQGNGCPYCSGHKAIRGKTDLATIMPSLASEWHPTKNGELMPSDVLPHSTKKVWWLCPVCSHEWEETINARSYGKKCPNCVQKEKVTIKEQKIEKAIKQKEEKKARLACPSLQDINPTLSKEWHPTKNGELNPSNVAPNSNKKVWWLCSTCGHEWEAMVNSRNKGSGCPNCNKNKVKLRGKSLLESFPQLASEWHPTKNNGLSPNQIGPGSTKSVWWLCPKGHDYLMPIERRTYNHAGCPYCSNSKVLVGYNDLQTLNPEIAKEWHPTKNGDLKPTDVVSGSGKKVWWLCSNGHTFQTIVKERTSSHGRGCPYCAGQKAIQGVNDLLTLNPSLASEWHPTKNGDLKPSDVMPMSNKSVWWLCKYHHEWKATVSKRSIGEGCPICQTFNRTSMPEYTIYYYLKKVFNDAINSYKASFLGTTEIDIFIPSKKIGVEYDGIWHKIERDVKKDRTCIENGITLVRVRSNKIKSYERTDPTFIINQKSKEDLTKVIKKIISFIDDKIDTDFVDVERDYDTIYGNYHSIKISNNLAEKYPKLASEWHPTKNGDLKPENVPATTSSKKYWWLCPTCGYEWEAQLNNRINRRQAIGCPVCSGKKVMSGYNDLATKQPILASEWHPTKNGDLKPENFTVGSNKKVWWKCNICGGEWDATINSRSQGGGCPFCSGKRVLPGYNDLATKNPHLASEWHPTKNKNLKPSDVVEFSGKKVWWLCSVCGHEWENKIKYRSNGSGCPNCKKLKGSYKRKQVLQINKDDDTIIEVYDSLTEASLLTGVDASNISMTCRGKTKTAGGFKWQFKK